MAPKWPPEGQNTWKTMKNGGKSTFGGVWRPPKAIFPGFTPPLLRFPHLRMVPSRFQHPQPGISPGILPRNREFPGKMAFSALKLGLWPKREIFFSGNFFQKKNMSSKSTKNHFWIILGPFFEGKKNLHTPPTTHPVYLRHFSAQKLAATRKLGWGLRIQAKVGFSNFF